MKKLLLLICLLEAQVASSQSINWDDVSKGKWGDQFKTVYITSSVDEQNQPAMFYSTKNKTAQPLVVSLHSWSGDYSQNNPLLQDILIRDCNFIQPNFRGPNNRPEACGSDLAISDIEDAIRYAIANGNVDPNEVHIVGASGGGYATLMCYIKITYPVKSFSAWVPISDLEAWYWESVGRKQKYAHDIMLCTGSKNVLNVDQAHKRSPLYLPMNKEMRKDATLHIYAGIHDGYRGSVPITHSINMYNRIVQEWYPSQINLRVPLEQTFDLIIKRTSVNSSYGVVGDRCIHYCRETPKVSLMIFEGGHEQVIDQVLGLIPMTTPVNKKQYKILTLGDSNGEAKYGWPKQLAMLYPCSKLINRSISGKTVSISNLNKDKLNSLLTIDTTLSHIDEPITHICIALGTNDAKAIYDDKVNEYKTHLEELINRIKSSSIYIKYTPELILLTVPPLNEQQADQKYKGATVRIQRFNKEINKIAFKSNIKLVDTYSVLEPIMDRATKDGVHFTPVASRMIALEIAKML